MDERTEYVELLARMDEAVRAFGELLTREGQLLLAIPVDAGVLGEVTRRKARQAETLQTLEDARKALALRLAAASGLDDAELAEALGLAERWQQLQVHVAEARTKNELNGQIIHTRMEGTRARLRFLRRHLGASAPLYGADGYRRASAYSGRLHAGA